MEQNPKETPSGRRPRDRRLPVHVAHLHTGREWGGGEYQVLHLVSRISAAGVATSLWAREGGALFDRARHLGLPVIALPRRWRLPFGAESLVRTLRRNRADLLHCHDSAALDLGLRLRRRLGLPLVLSRRIASPLRRNPASRLKYSARRIDAVIAISETVREILCRSRFLRDQISVVPSGIDIAELDALERDEAFRRQQGTDYLVAGIGKLSHKKNWSFLVRTAAAVQAQGLDVGWVLAGDGPERPRLEAEARDLGVASRVRFLGFREDAAQVLKSSDALFFPSLREGASVTVRQAMVLSVPVVAVDAAGVAESLAGHGWLVAADDPGDAARSVIDALTDVRAREAVCRAARQWAVQRYGFERTLEGTLDVYASVRSRFADSQRRS